MSEAKLYRISGYYMKLKTKVPLSFECKALKVEDAIEKAFSEIGSRHRVKRDRIFIAKKTDITEITVDEAKDPQYKEMDEENFEIY